MEEGKGSTEFVYWRQMSQKQNENKEKIHNEKIHNETEIAINASKAEPMVIFDKTVPKTENAVSEYIIENVTNTTIKAVEEDKKSVEDEVSIKDEKSIEDEMIEDTMVKEIKQDETTSNIIETDTQKEAALVGLTKNNAESFIEEPSESVTTINQSADSTQEITLGKRILKVLILIFIGIPLGIPFFIVTISSLSAIIIAASLSSAAICITGIALICSGVFLFVNAIISILSMPVFGLCLAGAGLLLLGIGILFLFLMLLIYKKLIPQIARLIRYVCRIVFQKKSKSIHSERENENE